MEMKQNKIDTRELDEEGRMGVAKTEVQRKEVRQS